MKQKRKYWTDAERQKLCEMYPDHYAADIAKLLNRQVGSVYSQAALMGLKKSEDFLNKELKIQGERLKRVGQKSRFVKNQPAFNKGQKMRAEIYEKCKDTMFKKGLVPHNTKYNGHERLGKDGYIEIRVQQGKYKLKHRYIWEQANGPIPKGNVIIFKDKNHLNITLENLEMITKKENMLRNSIMRFPRELRDTIKLVHKVKRAINEKQN